MKLLGSYILLATTSKATKTAEVELLNLSFNSLSGAVVLGRSDRGSLCRSPLQCLRQ